MGMMYDQSIVSVSVWKMMPVLSFVPSRSSSDPPPTEVQYVILGLVKHLTYRLGVTELSIDRVKDGSMAG